MIDTPRFVSAEHSPGASSNDPGASVPQANPEHSNGMDSAETPLLHELLGWIQAMGMIDDQSRIYDRVGLRPGDKEIRVPPITHLVTTIYCPAKGSPHQLPELRMVYVPVTDHPDSPDNLESVSHPKNNSGQWPIRHATPQ